MMTVTTVEMIQRVVVAILLGALIGLEREKKDGPAGIRTYALVTAGSALAMLIGVYTAQGPNVDPTRIGAQVISGIGFLGAGAIMRTGSRMIGLTTAASLWVMACIGLAVGAGMYEISIFSTFAIFVLLIFMPYIERYFAWKKVLFHISIKLKDNSNETHIITQLIKDSEIEIKSIDINLDRMGHKVLILSLISNDDITKIDFIEKLKEIGNVEIVK